MIHKLDGWHLSCITTREGKESLIYNLKFMGMFHLFGRELSRLQWLLPLSLYLKWVMEDLQDFGLIIG